MSKSISTKQNDGRRLSVRKTVYCGIFLALAITLPFLTLIPQIGNAFLLMHLPVMVCGVVCGARGGAAVGFLAPLLRSALFSMPVMYPNAIGMAFELATYGFMLGLLTKRLPKKLPYYYISLIVSMLTGRFVWGCVRFLMWALDAQGAVFSFEMFIAGAFSNAVIGVIIQIALIPLLTAYLNKNKGKIK